MQLSHAAHVRGEMWKLRLIHDSIRIHRGEPVAEPLHALTVSFGVPHFVFTPAVCPD
jgi:hypothetical protein